LGAFAHDFSFGNFGKLAIKNLRNKEMSKDKHGCIKMILRRL
jgi:hypothetical protein